MLIDNNNIDTSNINMLIYILYCCSFDRDADNFADDKKARYELQIIKYIVLPVVLENV